MSEGLDRAVDTGREFLKQLDELGIATPQSPTKVVSRLFRHAGIYPQPNFVVDKCDNEFGIAAAQAVEEGKSLETAKQVGRIAFCASLPRLSGASNIRDFIACVTYAMALDIIPSAEGVRLLYAAKVAHTALTKRPNKRGKSSQINTGATEAKIAKSTT
jgi:hypothetical protein